MGSPPTLVGMNSSRVALLASLAAAGSWTLKAVAIGSAGGLGLSPLEPPLFFAGLVSFVVAVVALGVALTRGRPRWLRVLAGAVAAPLVGIGLTLAVDAAVASVQPTGPARHWVWSEVNLWVACVALLVLAVTAHRAPRARTAPAGLMTG